MPRSKEQFNQMKEDRVGSIMESSLVLYSLYGEKITIDMIAEKAKCSHGIVYHYFKNVDEVIEKLLKSSFYNELKSSVISEYKGVLAKDAIYSITNILLNLKSIKEIAYANILLKETGKKSLYQCLISLVERGQKEDDIVGGFPNDIVQTLFYVLKGIYLNSLLKKTLDNYRPSIDNVTEIFRKKR